MFSNNKDEQVSINLAFITSSHVCVCVCVCVCVWMSDDRSDRTDRTLIPTHEPLHYLDSVRPVVVKGSNYGDKNCFANIKNERNEVSE